MIKSAQWVVCTKVYMTSDVHAHDRRVNEVCVCKGSTPSHNYV